MRERAYRNRREGKRGHEYHDMYDTYHVANIYIYDIYIRRVKKNKTQFFFCRFRRFFPSENGLFLVGFSVAQIYDT